MEELLKAIKEWIEEDTGPGFSYHIGHCDDLTHYYDMLREKLKSLGWKEIAFYTPSHPEKLVKGLIHDNSR